MAWQQPQPQPYQHQQQQQQQQCVVARFDIADQMRAPPQAQPAWSGGVGYGGGYGGGGYGGPPRPPMGQPVMLAGGGGGGVGPTPYYPAPGGPVGGGAPTAAVFVQPPPPVKKGGKCTPSNGADDFRNKWAIGMLEAPCANPVYFCFGCFCPICAVYQQRMRLLLEDSRNYVCCAGMFGPCSTSLTKYFSGRCGLCLEATCCLASAVHANRWMIQSIYGLENTCCDVFIMYVSCFCTILGIIASFYDQALGDLLMRISDLVFHITIGCLLAQQDHEMDVRNYPFNNPHIAVPAVQMMN